MVRRTYDMLHNLQQHVDIREKLPTFWPPFKSLKRYRRSKLKDDAVAALVITAVTAPQALGFALIVGLPVVTGLYSALFAPIIFAAFASTRRLIVGPDTATATILAAGAAAVAVPGTAEHLHVVAVITVLTGIILCAMALARFGFLADLISLPVLTGFLAGIGLQLIAGKLPSMLALPTQAGFFDKFVYIFNHWQNINLPTAVLAFGVVIFIIIGSKVAPKFPTILVALIGAGAAVSLLNLDKQGVLLTGQAATGLPGFSFVVLHFAEMEHVFATAVSIAIVIVAQSLATARSYAAKYDEKADDNQDLLALGMANMASSVTFGFTVTGSPSRTAIAERTGGSSQLVNVLMAVTIGALIVVASGLLKLVPVAALSAIVFYIGLSLINWRELINIWLARRLEFAICLFAMVTVALVGIEQGVVLAVIISLVDRLRRQYHPSDQILLKDRELSPWAGRILGHRTTPLPGILIYRFNGAIFFENTSYFVDQLKGAIRDCREPVQWVIVQSDAITDLDYTAARAIERLITNLNADDIKLVFSHVTPELRQLLRRYGLLEVIGEQYLYTSLHAAMIAFAGRELSTAELVKALELPSASCVVVGGGVLEALGIRETSDVDLVVNKTQYARLKKAGWHEYIHDDGKKVLYHGNYEAMLEWVGHNLQDLKRDSISIDGVSFIGLKKLIACKKRLGRPKDLKDIKLIQAFLAK